MGRQVALRAVLGTVRQGSLTGASLRPWWLHIVIPTSPAHRPLLSSGVMPVGGKVVSLRLVP